MKAMLLRAIAPLHQNPVPLAFEEISDPTPSPGEILLRVTRCGVCHTELDEIEGRIPRAASYNIYRGDAGGRDFTLHECLLGGVVVPCTSASVPLSGETGSRFYYYLVNAENSFGEGPLGKDSAGNVYPEVAPGRACP